MVSLADGRSVWRLYLSDGWMGGLLYENFEIFKNFKNRFLECPDDSACFYLVLSEIFIKLKNRALIIKNVSTKLCHQSEWQNKPTKKITRSCLASYSSQVVLQWDYLQWRTIHSHQVIGAHSFSPSKFSFS